MLPAAGAEPQRLRGVRIGTVTAVPNYSELTPRAQASRIRRIALAALADYDLAVARVRLVWHDFNTTFRVDTTDGRRFALRVNVNSDKQPEHLDAELAWLAAIATDTDIAVPAPHPTRSGALRTSAWCEELQRRLPVVVMSWLPGRDLDDGTAESVRALGRTMAMLHDHATRWSPPHGTAFPSHAAVLVDQPNRLGDDHPALDDRGREVLASAHRAAQDATDAVTRRGPVHALHADLHGGNVKWFQGRIAVFDFDDAVIGTPVQDLAISGYYLRDRPALEDTLHRGYAEVRSLPDVAEAEFEALVAGRNLILVNDVLGASWVATRDFAPVYVRNTVVKLRAFLDTGAYRHDVPGLEPIEL